MIATIGAFGIHGDGVWRKARAIYVPHREKQVFDSSGLQYTHRRPDSMPSLLEWWP